MMNFGCYSTVGNCKSRLQKTSTVILTSYRWLTVCSSWRRQHSSNASPINWPVAPVSHMIELTRCESFFPIRNWDRHDSAGSLVITITPTSGCQMERVYSTIPHLITRQIGGDLAWWAPPLVMNTPNTDAKMGATKLVLVTSPSEQRPLKDRLNSCGRSVVAGEWPSCYQDHMNHSNHQPWAIMN